MLIGTILFSTCSCCYPERHKFFHLIALSSLILLKVHFDVVMTMIADILYSRLAQNLRGFEASDAPKLYRVFGKGKGEVAVKDGRISVTYARRYRGQRLPQKSLGLMSRCQRWRLAKIRQLCQRTQSARYRGKAKSRNSAYLSCSNR